MTTQTDWIIPLTQTEIQVLNERFLNWYYEYGRAYLPWRQKRTPYGTWVSEIMLQQTRVDTVIPYFQRFMATFQTIEQLATAKEEDVLKHWEGLGYYSRAKNLQKGAQQVLKDYNGVLPKTANELVTIKGIGPYTAGAISSMAFQQKSAAIDGNTMRIFARLFEINEDIAKPSTVKKFFPFVEKIMSPDHPGDFNQALMDLGSSICMPKVVHCKRCPLQSFCQSYAHDTPFHYPVKSKKTKPKEIYYAAFAIQNEKKHYVLEQRETTGLLANFWHFPLVELTKEEFETLNDPTLLQTKLKKIVKQKVDIHQIVLQKKQVGIIQHVFSHLKWHVMLFYGRSKASFTLNEKQQFVSLLKTDYPLPKAQQKMMELLEKKNHLL